MEPFWNSINGPDIRQGDFLPDCLVPTFHPDFGTDAEQTETVQVDQYDLIVLTQSCDLANNKARLVALSPIYAKSDFEQVNTQLQQRGQWERVRQGRVEGLHLLASPQTPDDNQLALVVNFREVYSLPIDYLMKHAQECGDRWRLRSPYLEHFSQAFARFFMRVGLPSSIPAYR